MTQVGPNVPHVVWQPKCSSRVQHDVKGNVRRYPDGSAMNDYRTVPVPIPEPDDSPFSAFVAAMEESGNEQFVVEAYLAGATLVAHAKTWKDRGKITDATCEAWINEHGFDEQHVSKLRGRTSDERIAYARDLLASGQTAADKDATEETAKIQDRAFKAVTDGYYAQVLARTSKRLTKHD